MDSKAIFSTEHPGLRTYGCRTKSRDRPRGILLQKKQNKALAVSTGNFSLSDDSDDIQNVKDNKRKVSSATKGRKAGATPIQKRTRKPARQSNARNKAKTASKMKPTPKHGLQQSNQLWVKTKIRGSDSEDSIELPRRDQELTWQEKISLLMPKMTENLHHPDRKVPGYNKIPGCSRSVLNLSAEEVIEEEDEESSTEDQTDHIQAAPRVSMPNVFAPKPSPHVHSPLLDKPEVEHVEENKENDTKNSKLPTGHVTAGSDDYTYTYEWVTDMADSLPASHQASKAGGQGHASLLKSPNRISSLSKETGNRKSSAEQTCIDIYTYEWVTDSDTGQNRPASSCSSRSGQVDPNTHPSGIVQQIKADTFVNSLEKKFNWSKSDDDRMSHGYFNSTEKPGAVGVFKAKFPEDLSVIKRSPSLVKKTHRGVQQMNSTRKNDGLDIDMIKLPDMSVIERISPVKEQVALLDLSKTVTEDDKVPRCLSSTRKNGGLDFDKDKFSLDVSEIKEFNSVEDRPDHIQLSQEITPVARQTKQEAIRTPVKSISVIPKKKRKLLPQSSTVLFVTGCTGDLINYSPSLSAITSSQNTECIRKNIDVTKDGPVKRMKCSYGEKDFFTCSANSIWKEDIENAGKILTSTPVSSTQTQFQRPEVNLTCVPRPCFEDELEINESIEVNSDEIVPDLTKEDIFTEEVTILPKKHKGCEGKNPQKTPDENRNLVSISSLSETADQVKSSVESTLESADTSFCKRLSVKPITKSSMMSNITECCLTDPRVVFPHKKSICYRKTSQEVYNDKTRMSEDMLLTYNFKRR